MFIKAKDDMQAIESPGDNNAYEQRGVRGVTDVLAAFK